MSAKDIQALPLATDVLSVDGLTAGYGRAVVLRNVSISVPARGATAVLGPNGAGKSTLLRAISGLVATSQGEIKLAGRDITRARADLRAKAGLCHVREGRGIFRSLTVRENLVMQVPRGQADVAISKAAEVFPILGQRLSQRAGSMSGGQQQMLALVAAYVRNPSLIMVDEASLGLAPIIVDEIFDFLRLMVERGTALLMVDQFAQGALDLAEKVYVLRRGEVAFSGAANELADGALLDHYLGSEPALSSVASEGRD